MKYHILNYGCKLNQAESSNLEKTLSDYGIKSSEKEADLIIINSCGVVQKTENKIILKANKLKKDKKIIITGCLPAINPKIKEDFHSLDGNNPKKLNNYLEKEYQKIKLNPKNFLSSIKAPESKSLILPISTGCLGSCTYCGARLARGKLISFNMGKIVSEIENSDAKEIQLTSQDLGIYGMDKKNLSLLKLIKEILKINRDFKLKLGMMNPGHLIEYFDDFLKLFENEKLYRFIHIPVQSGSESVLIDMKRNHTVADFTKIVEKAKNFDKNFLIATDIIVGFPTESDNFFMETCKLIEKTKPNILNITRYSERKGTEAEKLKDIPELVKKNRSRELTKLAKEIRLRDNKNYLGVLAKVLVIQKKGDSFLSRMNNGKAVILKNGVLGEFKNVKINGYTSNYLIAD